MKTEIIDKWFETHQTLTVDNYNLLKEMYSLIKKEMTPETRPATLEVKKEKPNRNAKRKKTMDLHKQMGVHYIKKYNKNGNRIIKELHEKLVGVRDTSERKKLIKEFYPYVSESTLNAYSTLYHIYEKHITPRQIRISSKICTKCKQMKPVTAFYRHNKNKDGLQAWCKECIKSNQSSLREATKEIKTPLWSSFKGRYKGADDKKPY